MNDYEYEAMWMRKQVTRLEDEISSLKSQIATTTGEVRRLKKVNKDLWRLVRALVAMNDD